MDVKHTLAFRVETAGSSFSFISSSCCDAGQCPIVLSSDNRSARTWEIEVGSTTELNEWMETFTILALVTRCQTFIEKEVRYSDVVKTSDLFRSFLALTCLTCNPISDARLAGARYSCGIPHRSRCLCCRTDPSGVQARR